MRFLLLISRQLILIFSTIIVGGSVLAQEYQAFETYKSQIIGGVNLNTNAGLIGGIMVRYSRHIVRNKYHYFGVEITNVKHPKEITGVTSAGNLYTPYKLNAFIPIRLQYGREFLVFQPAEEEGVQVNLIIAGGLSFGILKPYTIEYDYNGVSKIEQFDPDQTKGIIGRGPIFSGFDKAKIIPGINLKASLSIEFAKFRGNVTGIEGGFLVESYTTQIKMMAISKNIDQQPTTQNTFTSIFLNIFFGFRN